MRVLIISHMFPSSFNPVAGTFVLEQAQALSHLGVDVTVVSPVPWAPKLLNFQPKWARYAQIPERSEVNGISVFYPRVLSLPRSLGYSFYGEIHDRMMRSLLERLHRELPFDLVHAHVALPDGSAARHFAKRHQVPLVVTIHGQDFYYTIHQKPAWRKAVMDVLEAADRVVVVSSKLKGIAESEQLMNDVTKTEIIHNGANLQAVYRGDNPLREDYTGKLILLTVGYLIARKGHDYVLQAMAHLIDRFPNLHYLIIGDGEERPHLEERVRTLGLTDHVEFLGLRPHQEVLQYMDLCDIFVLPSWDEAFGVVYVEAMSQGCLVIGCVGEGIEDFVETGKTGFLVPSKDVDGLARVLDKVCSDPVLRTTVGSNAKTLVENQYSWERCAERLITLYASLLSPT